MSLLPTFPLQLCEYSGPASLEGLSGSSDYYHRIVLKLNGSGLAPISSVGNVYNSAVGAERLNETNDNDRSLDTEERAERKEEKTKDLNAFGSMAMGGLVSKADFGKLMEAMGTVYCEEEHRRTIR